MGTIKAKNSFEGGLNKDTTPEAVKNNELLDAVNMEITGDGRTYKLQNIRGTTEVSTYLPAGYDAATLNVLGVFEVYANYDKDNDGTFEEKNVSLLIFSYDANSGSVITLVDLTDGSRNQMYPNSRDTSSLGLPPLGTVDASYTEERGSPQVYWDDNKNVLRGLNLNFSTHASFLPPSLRELEVRKRYPGGPPVLQSIQDGGVLYAGTYQIAFRFYNTNTGAKSDASLLCNPIAIAKSDGTLSNYDQQLGGDINEIVNKKIILSVDTTIDEAAYYDAIQLIVIKNIDGTTIPSGVAYITAPSTAWYNNPSAIEYTGLGITETTIPIEDVIVEDAGIKCAKTQVIKDNRLFRGNIKYYDRSNDNGAPVFDDAYTITQDADFKPGEETNRHKGYFRKEVYAFGIAYHDEYMNFGDVTPLDFSNLYRANVKTTVLCTGFTPLSPTRWRVTLASTSGLEVGDDVSYNSISAKIIGVTASYIDINANILIVAGAQLNILYGQSGNQSSEWTWKFPDRSDNQYTIIGANNHAKSIGLHIKGIRNHPSWAKGFVIVRQKRVENILYQSPLIPTVGVLGVPTQGVGPIEYDKNDPDIVFDDDADYKGDYNTLMPKVLGMGMAKNIAKYQLNFQNDATLESRKRYYTIFYPYYKNHESSFSDTRSASNYGAEIPNYALVFNPEYVFNKAGSPTYYQPNQGNNKIVVVDAIAYRHAILQEDGEKMNIANTYQALNRDNYFYNSDGKITDNGSDRFFVKLTDFISDITPNKIIQDKLLVLNGSEQLLTNRPFSSELFEAIEYFGYLQKLTEQQGESNAVPAGTKNFLSTVANQRAILLNLDAKVLDFTYWIWQKYFNEGINLFPLITTYKEEIYKTTILNDIVGDITDAGVKNITGDIKVLPVKNIFIDEGEIAGGCYIVNNERGLSDNRYSRVSSEWIFTGIYVKLTDADVSGNVAKDVDVWGGDCFISKYVVKVNNNTQRISDIYENVHAEAGDYDVDGQLNDPLQFHKNCKTGCFKDNVEFLELFIESKVNTTYHQEINEYPAYTGTQIANYSNPYFYRYNGSYSVNNESKVFVSRDTETFVVNKYEYPAREVWSDQRLYQADGSGFVDTDGFSVFRVLNRKDLDEQYGEITKLLDLGGNTMYAVQSRKIFVNPIGMDRVQTGDARVLTLGTAAVIGDGGQYLPYDIGSQHIRTVKSHNGTASLVDAKKQQVVLFNGGSFDIISNQNMVSYFKALLASDAQIREIDLACYIDATQDNMDLIVAKRAHAGIPQDFAVYGTKLKAWKPRLSFGGDILLNGVYAGQQLYLLNQNKAYSAYTNPMRGLLFGSYRDSSFKFVVNDYPGFVKIFNTMNFDMNGGLIVNQDSGTALVPSVNPAIPDQNATLLLWDVNSVQPKPFQYRNYQYWLNRFRNVIDRSKLRGHYMETQFVIVNNLADNREVSVMSIQTDCETSYRNR